jgi:UDP-N-acetylglucosamine transferase subunit ALG13
MIFATVGTQLPFGRLVRALDQWASHHPHEEIFAQIGQADYVPEYMEWARTIPAETFRAKLQQCDTVVSHAGMGTIISAAELGKTVVVMPRRAELGEHRNDHQLATVRRLGHLNGLRAVHDCEDLARVLDGLQAATSRLSTLDSAAIDVSDKLITKIRAFAGLVAL